MDDSLSEVKQSQNSHFQNMMDEIEDSDESDDDDDNVTVAAAKPGRRINADAKRPPSNQVSSPTAKCEMVSDSDTSSDEDSKASTVRRRRKESDGFSTKAPKPSNKSLIKNPLSLMTHDEAASMKRFITSPIRKDETRMIQCYITRDKRGTKFLKPLYRMYLEEGKQFVLAGQKRTGTKTSNYLMSMDEHPTDRRSNLVVGKLRANFVGSNYVLYDNGLNPKNTALESSTRNVLGVVQFKYDKMGPGNMEGCIPRVSEAGVPLKVTDFEGGDGEDDAAMKMANAMNQGGTDTERIMVMRNKVPKYDEKAGGYVLDFDERVTMSSVKNFQLDCDDTGDDTVLQFGRISCQPPGPHDQCDCHKDTFNIDFKYPLSPLQAFGICLATLDGKISDNKGFETLSALSNKFKK